MTIAGMGMKRAATEMRNGRSSNQDRPSKKQKQMEHKIEKPKLVFDPRPDWHATQLPNLDVKDVAKTPALETVKALHEYGNNLLESDNGTYASSNLLASSSHKFLSTIMASGTLEDKISALTLLVQESPLHTMKAFENLINLARKKSRNQALMAVAALKDLLGQGVVLPGHRKLRAFGKQPLLLGAIQGKAARWTRGDALPIGLQKIHLIVWAFEDWLKSKYFELLQILESWCGDEVAYSRSRAITYVWELLKEKPEQEENLLRLLVNKLGDTDRKIASRASYLLLQLEITHPAMKIVVTNAVEADCLFRPGQSLHAKYYAVITLNQTILSVKEQDLASRLLDIYFSLFVQLLKPVEKPQTNSTPVINGKVQGGGGKPGKMAAKKAKQMEKSTETDEQLREKMVAQVLAGVNRAFPFADTSDPTFEKQIDTIFRVTHSSNFNTSIQALMLIQQISSTKHYAADRFYRTLYESLLDLRLLTSSKQIMYLNLVYKSLKADINVNRVQAFVKRLLQIINLHEPPFACGVLYLISELEATFPSVRNMMTEAEVDDEDEDEHFVDVPEDAETVDTIDNIANREATSSMTRYDPKKRDPEHSNADRSCLWELLPLISHFHPSVSLFANNLLQAKTTLEKPDPEQHTLIHFLDRFVYRNAKSRPATTHGASIMQPMVGSRAAGLLIRDRGDSRGQLPLNSNAFWQRKVEDVAADEVFFHSYFNQSGRKKMAAKKEGKQRKYDGSESEDEGEEEIWKALVNSKPEVEGPDEDNDDLSMGDIEEAYSDDEDESSGETEHNGEGLMLDDGSEGGDDLPELDSDEDALLGDKDDVPMDMDAGKHEEPEEQSKSKKRRQDRKKLKQLPTFASAEDYEKLLAQEDDEV